MQGHRLSPPEAALPNWNYYGQSFPWTDLSSHAVWALRGKEKRVWHAFPKKLSLQKWCPQRWEISLEFSRGTSEDLLAVSSGSLYTIISTPSAPTARAWLARAEHHVASPCSGWELWVGELCHHLFRSQLAPGSVIRCLISLWRKKPQPGIPNWDQRKCQCMCCLTLIRN